MGSIDYQEPKCWVTLLTSTSYIPGVVILAHSLDQHASKYPLVVQYTSSLDQAAISVLEAESRRTGRIVLDHVKFLSPRAGQENTAIVADRFKDTFTKLRAFEVYKLGFIKACYLDADMAVYHNPDSIFDIALPSRDWLGANHACVCNLDGDSWAPANWRKGNCAYTTITNPDQTFRYEAGDYRPTYHLLNGGMFLFYPTEKLWQSILNQFNTSDELKTYQFPDQDFLADYFRNRWQPISWKYNALKTMRYIHPDMWCDEQVIVVHYIVDKPWDRRVSDDGVAGHLGRDGETHQWWWNIYESWLKSQDHKSEAIIDAVTKFVNTREPFRVKIPLPQAPGNLEDVARSP